MATRHGLSNLIPIILQEIQLVRLLEKKKKRLCFLVLSGCLGQIVPTNKCQILKKQTNKNQAKIRNQIILLFAGKKIQYDNI